MAEIRDYGHILNPTFTRITLSPGKQVTGTFRYSNAFFSNSEEVKEFVTRVAFIYQVNGVPTVYTTIPENLRTYDMSTWVTVKETDFQLKKGSSLDIHYSISVPIDPQLGGKYAVILVLPKEKLQEVEGTGAQINASIGFPIIGKMAGEARMNSEIVSFDTDKKIYWSWPKKQIVFSTELRNTGNVDYLPGGDIFIHTGDITKPIKEFIVNENDLVILPDNTRTYTNAWEATEPLVSRKGNGIFFNFEYFRIGKYTATAKLGYDVEGTRVVANREVSFWILPMPLIVAILTVILVSSLGVLVWKKRQKRQLRLADKKNTTS